MDSVLALLDKVMAGIPLPGSMVLLALGVLIELLVRLVPTARPKSLLLVASNAIRGVGGLLSKVGELVSKLSAALDALLQNVKDDAPKA